MRGQTDKMGGEFGGGLKHVLAILCVRNSLLGRIPFLNKADLFLDIHYPSGADAWTGIVF